jgi:predicted esterase
MDTRKMPSFRKSFDRWIVSVALSVSVICAQSVVAQQVDSSLRLTVRPQTMATGAHNDKSGRTPIAGYDGYYVYVPKSAVGAKRVPLIMLLHGGGRSATMELAWAEALAEKYGVIVFAPTSTRPGRWDIITWVRQATSTEAGMEVPPLTSVDVPKLDSALHYVLHNYAIDPKRIALLGFSDGGSSSLLLGRANQDIFSRIAALSALIPFHGRGPDNPDTQFYLSGGIAEGMVPQTLKMAQVLRHEGHQVMTLLGLRGHVDHSYDEDFIWQWLMQSWADPTVTAQMNAKTLAPKDSDPVLTVDALTKMTTFWTKFQQEPDSVLQQGRTTHQHQLQLALGGEPVLVITTDMRAMAKLYPSVAADLKAAGLTAQQEEQYRAAILRVGFARMGGIAPGDAVDAMPLGRSLPFAQISATSVLAKNLAFRQAHDAEFKALSQTGMWTTQ